MYLDHYGLTEAPFRITPHTDFFFSGANRGATLEALLYAITHDEGIVKISGEVGSGKTMLCRVLMERLPETVVIIYLANPSLSRDDILYALADELGITVPEQSRSGAVMRALQETLVKLHAEGRQVVVLIDEAHAMPMETLEEIRLLSNLETNRHKLLQLVLFGQPELNATLARDDMRQLRERITHNFGLEPLAREEIEKYLDFRMRAAGYKGPNVFAPAAINLISQASQGLTRRINILADKALLATFAAGSHQVGIKEARAAIRDSEFSGVQTSLLKSLPIPLMWAAGGAAMMLLAMGAWQALFKPTQESAPSATPTSLPEPSKPIDAPSPSPATPPPPATTIKPAEPSPTESPVTPVSVSQPAAAEIAALAATELDRALAAGKVWIEQTADQHWFIQLYTTTETQRPDLVEKYLLKAQKAGLAKESLRAYHATLDQTSRYGIIYGDYVSRQDAVNALNRLPDELKQTRPYARKAVRLKLNHNME
jgi:MSHA biogenesis protein MshM